VLELFTDPARLPDAIAQTVIVRKSTDAPIASWSLGNQLLCLLSGTADARGFKQWQEADRHVVKGARAIRILGPCKRTITETDKTTGERVKRSIVTGFTAIPVFKVEDTDGAPVERVDYRPAVLPPLFDVSTRLGVSVDWVPFSSRYRGCYSPAGDAIVLASWDERTWFHELSHAAHERVLVARGGALKGGQQPRQEIVAEVCAAVLCRLYGPEGYLPHSREYVDHYAGEAGPARAAMRVLGDIGAVLAILLDDPVAA
jgi:antirestriction protein ArdC